MERIATGQRINRAADAPAGLAISERMRAQIRGLNMAARNAQDTISLVQTAEGALQGTHDILQRMRELTVQAGNGTLSSSDRQAIIEEMKQLEDEINRISKDTQFNSQNLLELDLGNNVPPQLYQVVAEVLLLVRRANVGEMVPAMPRTVQQTPYWEDMEDEEDVSLEDLLQAIDSIKG